MCSFKLVVFDGILSIFLTGKMKICFRLGEQLFQILLDSVNIKDILC